MSLSERIAIVNQKNTQRENELIKQLNSLALSIKNEIEDHTKKPAQNPKQKQNTPIQQAKQQPEQQPKKPSKSELFYESSNEHQIVITIL